MTDPFRLQVQKALSDILEEINPTDNYWHDLTPTIEVPQRVFRGRVIFGEEDPIPMVSILEVPVPIDPINEPSTSPVGATQWELILQGWVKDDKQNPTDPAHFLLADVKRRLAIEKSRDRGNNILGLGGRVDDLRMGSGVVRPPDDISAKAYFWLNVTLGLVENWCEQHAGN